MRLFAFLCRQRNISLALYQTINMLARNPLLYGTKGAPDSFDGRFDILVVHVYFVLRRLRGLVEAQAHAQNLCDVFFADMDMVLREQGVSDTRVGRHMRKIAEAFYGRARAYDSALAGQNGMFVSVLARNLYPTAAADKGRQLENLATYFRMLEQDLASCVTNDILRGDFVLKESDVRHAASN